MPESLDAPALVGDPVLMMMETRLHPEYTSIIYNMHKLVWIRVLRSKSL